MPFVVLSSGLRPKEEDLNRDRDCITFCRSLKVTIRNVQQDSF
jgi:hypothetical protein